jgi:hypothetical protein
MEWVPSEGIRHYEWQTPQGETIRHRDFLGGAMDRERGSRVAGVAQVIDDVPTAFITSRPPENVIEPHFHELPQYQLFIQGRGRVGKHGLQPLTVHYTDPYTPYGPIVASEDGLAFMTLRAQTSNGGAFRMPKARPFMVRKAGRALTAVAGVKPSAAPPGQVGLEDLIPLMDDGVEAKLVSLGAGATCRLPESGASRDRFLVVASGALVREGNEYATHSCAFLRAGEPTPELAAGSQGAQVLVLRFPPPVPHAA